MNSINKDFFSQSVHKYIVYSDIDNTLKKYEKRILRELELRKLNKDFLKNKTIIDIGTGFQSIIAHKLGAKFIYHLDLSMEQITWMNKYCNEHKIENIKSIQCDITKQIPINESIDLVFAFGIWHHLKSPRNFINNLLPILNPHSSDIWLRIYRSGTWSRWLTNLLRMIAKDIDQKMIEKLLKIRYPNTSLNQWKGDLMDDLFSPVWQAFHPNQFKSEGISKFSDDASWEYNFNEYDENFRVDFNIKKNNFRKFKNFKFPNKGIDQNELTFKSDYHQANEIQELFQQWDVKRNSARSIEMIFTIYELLRRKPIYDAYTLSVYKQNIIEDNTFFQKRLKVLLDLLKLFIKEQ